jgi:hypothetical protein
MKEAVKRAATGEGTTTSPMQKTGNRTSFT